MKVSIFSAIFLLLAASLHARIGESETELIRRFGAPIDRADHSVDSRETGQYQLGESLTFRLGDWWIACDLVAGRCARISYSKTGSWTEDNFESILSANTQGGNWKDLLSPSMKSLMRKWRRDDGAIAHWVVGSLSITSPEYEKTRAIAEQAAVSPPAPAFEVERLAWPALFRFSPVGQKINRLRREERVEGSVGRIVGDVLEKPRVGGTP